MPAQIIQTIAFTQIIALNSYLDNLGKPLNSTLNAWSNFDFPFNEYLFHRISFLFLGNNGYPLIPQRINIPVNSSLFFSITTKIKVIFLVVNQVECLMLIS